MPRGSPLHPTPDPLRVRRLLLTWYRRIRRDLPWRSTRDPYAILVAEVMLQQTRVETVIPYYRRFLQRYPDLQSLAAASPEEVLACWRGLGYYRRALQLHRLAREVRERYGGRLPDDEAALRTLPGVGDYTAGALLSIAYGRPRPAVDGNALRVLARLAGEQEPVDASAVRRRLRALAAAWVDPQDPGGFNQALMELGATLCRPRHPRCGECPLAGECVARRLGLAEALPRRRDRRRATPEVRTAALVRRADGAVLLARRRPRTLLGGLWELPAAEGDPAALVRAAAQEWGLALESGRTLATLTLAFSHRVWHLQVVACAATGAEWAERPAPDPYDCLRWWPPAAIPDLPVPAALARWLVQNLEGNGSPQGEG